ncbi:unnamed protein product [Natator depressus]
MIFMARQIQEKSQEKNQDLYMAFIDLTKAFDSVNHEVLWKMLARFGCPPIFIKVLRLLHNQMTATVLCNGLGTELFVIKTGVNQGCVSLFSIYLAVILVLIRDHLSNGVDIQYRMDGRLFNLQHLHSKCKVFRASITDIQYTDDCVILVHTENDLQSILDFLAQAYQSRGLSLNIEMTKVLSQPASGLAYDLPQITIKGQTLEIVEHFCYLSSQLSQNAKIDSEIQHRIQ